MHDGKKEPMILTIGCFEHGYLEKERLGATQRTVASQFSASEDLFLVASMLSLLPLTGSNPKEDKQIFMEDKV